MAFCFAALLLVSAEAALKARVWSTTRFDAVSGLVNTLDWGEVNNNWGGSAPQNLPSNDKWSMRWEGLFRALTTTTYTFCTQTDDGSKLFINGVLVVNSFILQDQPLVCSTPIPLTSGVDYPIRMDYFDYTFNAVAYLTYSTPSINRRTVDNSLTTPTFLPSVQASLIENIINNGGCDSGSLSGWTTVSGSWVCSTAQNYQSTGSFLATSIPSGQAAELRQVIDLSEYSYWIDLGRLYITFVGWTYSTGGGSDDPQVIIEYAGANGVFATGDDTGSVSLDPKATWEQFFVGGPNSMPAGTRSARIRLLSWGAASKIYFDALRFDVYASDSFVCNGATATQFVTSSRFLIGDGSGRYASNLQCLWSFNAQNQGQYRISILSTPPFDTEASADFLRIFDNSNWVAPALATFSGSSPSSPATTTTANVVTVSFTSNAFNSGTGFVADVELVLFPVLSSVSPTGAVGGSTSLTLFGSNFGTVISRASVLLGADVCPVTFVNTTVVICALPTPTTTGVVTVSYSYSQVAARAPLPTFEFFLPAAVASASPSGGVPGSRLTILGSNFGSSAASLQVTLNSGVCTIVSFTSSRIECTVPAGSGLAPIVVQRLGATASGPLLTWQFVNNVVLSALLPFGARAGDPFTLQGSDFGSDPSAIRISVGGIDCPISSGSLFPNGTQVVCSAVPAALGTSAPLVAAVSVGVYTLTSNSLNFNVIKAPTVISVAPAGSGIASVPAAAPILVLTGTGFGTLPSDLSVALPGGASCAVIAISASQLNCTIISPPSTESQGAIALFRYRVPAAPVPSFSFIASPTVSSVTPLGGGSGTKITLSGTGFGTLPDDVTVWLATTPVTLCDISAVTSTSLICTLRTTSTVGQFPVRLQRFSVLAPSAPTFTLVAPVLAAVFPRGGGSGQALTIQGSFGAFVTASDLVVTINGALCPISAPAPNSTHVFCTVPNLGVFNVFPVQLSHFGIPATFSSQPTFESAPLPTVSRVSPSGGTIGLSPIIVSGSGFGASIPDLDIFVGSARCAVILATPTEARCTLSAAPSIGVQNVTITRFGVLSSQPPHQQFQYVLPPILTAVSPGLGQGGLTITISGNFAPSSSPASCAISTFSVNVGDKACVIVANSLSPNCSSIVCTLPDLSTIGNQTVQLLRFAAPSATNGTVEYIAAPRISTLNPAYGRAGTVITLTGTGFGTQASDLSVSAGASPCVLVPASLVSAGAGLMSLQCTMPSLAGQRTISIVRAGVASSAPNPQFSYADLPIINSVSPRGGISGSLITLLGVSLGTSVDVVAVTVDGTLACTGIVVNQYGSQVSCTLPALSNGVHTIALTRNAIPAANNITFIVVNAPRVVSLVPSSGYPGITLEVNLQNPMPTGVAETDISVSVGPNTCSLVAGNFTSGASVVRCRIPPGPVGAQTVILSLFNSLPSSETTHLSFTYNTITVPLIVSISPAGGMPGSTVTVTGGGYGSDPLQLSVLLAGISCTIVSGSLNSIGTQLQFVVPPSAPSPAVSQLTIGRNGFWSPQFDFSTIGAPTVNSITPRGGRYGFWATITGSGFGSSAADITVSLGGSICSLAGGVLNDTTAICLVSPGVLGANQPITVLRYSTAATSTATFSYIDAPILTSLTPAGGFAAGGSTLTIYGTGFGSEVASIRVTLGASTVCVPTSVTPTQVICTMGATSETGALALRVFIFDTVSDNELSYLIVSPPTLSSISPKGGVGGEVAVLTATNLGAVESALSVFVGATAASIVSGSLNADGTRLSILMPTIGATGAQSVSVNLYNAASIGSVSYLYISAPSVTSVSPAGGVAGTVITISGSNFGAVQGDVTVTVGTILCPIFGGTVSDNSIRCTVPIGTAGDQEVVVRRYNTPSAVTGIFSFVLQPVITSIRPQGGVSGTTMTISGLNFGETESAALEVLIEGTTGNCPIVQGSLNSDGTTLQCTISWPTSAPIQVQVSRFSVRSDIGSTFELISAPDVTEVQPQGGGKSVSTQLIVSGAGFGSEVDDVSVSIGELQCQITTIADDSLSCLAPAGLSGVQPVQVIRYNVPSPSNPAAVFYYAETPTVDRVLPSGGGPGTQITIYGRSFGSNIGPIQATVGGLPCLNLSLSAEALTCTLAPELSSGLQEVVVTVYGVPSFLPNEVFTLVDPPQILSLSPVGGKPGDFLTLLGSNFGSFESDIVVLINGVVCDIKDGSLLSSGTKIVVQIPASLSGVTGLVPVVIKVFGVTSLDSSFLLVPTPTITATSPVGGLVGTALTVVGTDFGQNLAQVSVLVGGFLCETIDSDLPVSGPGMLTCAVPSAQLGPQTISVVRLGVSSVDVFTFTYINRPLLLDVSPLGGVSGTLLTLTGRNFGDSPSLLSVKLAGVDCPISSVNYAGTSVICQAPTGPPEGDAEVNITRIGIPVPDPLTFRYVPRPVVRSVSPSGGQAGQVMTISGTGFGDDERFISVFVGSALCTLVLGSLSAPSMGNQTLECRAPSLGNGPQSLSVRVYQVQSLESVTFSYILLPRITRLSVAGGTINDTVTITGTEFGDNVEELRFSLGGVDCPIDAFDNRTGQAVIRIGEGSQPGVFHFVVTHLELQSIPQFADLFTVTPRPFLNAIYPIGGAVGSRVTVFGQHFGNLKNQLNVFVGSALCTSPEPNAAGTQVVCQVGASAEGFQPVSVTRFGHASIPAPNVTFHLVPIPRVTSVEPAGGQRGSSITLVGTDFGADEASLEVFVGDSLCSTAAGFLLSQTQLSCNVSMAAVGGTQAVRVCRYGSVCSASTAVAVFTVVSTPPVLTALDPPASAPGLSITLRGQDFGRLEGAILIMIGSQPCVVVNGSLNSAGTAVACMVGDPVDGEPSLQPVLISVFDISSSESVSFEYVLVPMIQSVSPRGGAVGTLITIQGQHFGRDIANIRVLIGGEQCVTPLLSNLPGGLQQLTCTVTGSLTGAQDVVVSNYRVESDPASTGASEFQYVPPPRIQYVDPEGGFAAEFVTLVGANFGTELRAISILIGQRPCSVAQNSLLNGTTVVCRIASVLGADDFGPQVVTMKVYGVSSLPPNPTFYYLVDSMLYFPRWSSPEGAAFAVLCSLAFVVACSIAAIVVRYRRNPIIIYASPMFCLLILIGHVISLIGVLAMIGRPTASTCLAATWLPSIGLNVMLSNLFLKAWRVWRLFDNKSMKRIIITDRDLLSRVFVFLALDLVILMAWASVSPPVPTIAYGSPSSIICDSPRSSMFALVSTGYKFLLLAFGSFLAWNVRGVQSKFNESRHIAFSIYNVFILVVLRTALETSLNNQKAVFVFTALGDLLIVWTMTLTLFGPKLYAIYTHQTPEDAGTDTGTGTTISAHNPDATGTTAFMSHAGKM